MKSALSHGLLVVVACNCVLVAAEPEKKAPLKFPARMEVVSSKRLDDGRRELDLKIILEKDVQVYAEYENDAFIEAPLARVWLLTTAGDKLPVTAVFPKPNVIEDVEGFGKVYSYSESIRFRATYAPPDNWEDLKLQCKLGGRTRTYCLGFHRQVEVAIPVEAER